jgi:hypothetical protein
VTLALALACSLVIAASQDAAPPACATWQECRALALEAAGRQDYETFHDLAWRAVQRGPRNDPALMTLLARAQSLSGRPGDALVMLRRLADLGVGTDAPESDDFRRVRALAGWADLQARLAEVGAAKAAATSPETPKTTPALLSGPARVNTSPPPTSAAPLAGTRAEDVVGDASDALRFSTTAFTPGGLAYDGVSNRFIIGDRREHKLAVIGERSQRVTTLTGAQSAGFGEIAALEIDRHEGDLWVVSVTVSGDQPSSRLHKLQLISGRPLFTIAPPADAGPTRFADVSLTPSSTVLVLDRDGRRLFRAAPRSRELQVAAILDVEAPVSVAAASDEVAYVAHPGGLLRVDLAGLVWIRWHRGSMVAVQSTSESGYRIIRIGLDGPGRTARRLTLLDRAVPMADPSAAALSGDVLYYLADTPRKESSADVETIVRRVTVK